MRSWILKPEPSDYSFERLMAEGRTRWDGITNNLALLHLRAMRRGDRAIVYHTGDERSAVGTAQITRDPYPDPNAGNPRILVVDVEAGEPFPKSVPLDVFRREPLLATTDLVRISRLSIVPITDEQWSLVERLAGVRPRRKAKKARV